MQTSFTLLFVSIFVLSAQLSRSHGMALRDLEKRGWTLNSAGYLLGPYAQRTLTVRNRPGVGKRESMKENSILQTNQPSFRSITDDSHLNSVLELLTFLRMKENGILNDMNSSTLFDSRTQ